MTNGQSIEATQKRIDDSDEFDRIIRMIEGEKNAFVDHVANNDIKFTDAIKRIKKLERQVSDIHVDSESEPSEYDDDETEIESDDEELSEIDESPKTPVKTAAFDYECFDKERFTQPVDDFSEDFTQLDAFDESQINGVFDAKSAGFKRKRTDWSWKNQREFLEGEDQKSKQAKE